MDMFRKAFAEPNRNSGLPDGFVPSCQSEPLPWAHEKSTWRSIELRRCRENQSIIMYSQVSDCRQLSLDERRPTWVWILRGGSKATCLLFLLLGRSNSSKKWGLFGRICLSSQHLICEYLRHVQNIIAATAKTLRHPRVDARDGPMMRRSLLSLAAPQQESDGKQKCPARIHQWIDGMVRPCKPAQAKYSTLAFEGSSSLSLSFCLSLSVRILGSACRIHD